MAKDKHQQEQENYRLDKWLWAARFYKTRTLAREMVDGGKVHYNGQRTKPSKEVEIGAMIKLRQGNDEKEVQVLALSNLRKAAPLAQQLYQETEESIKRREQLAWSRKANALSMPNPERRPNKKERRDLLKFKYQQ
ncbi:ribosome-associated heat shock protein Hsp15 [Gallibacterium genomosp. 2]|uniref:Heat shock protein 15 n=1 Tax=Gallibacterium genomosp. 2 TaxID=155517 RepID=A0A0A2XC91_9PAST|nr:ribosome-associated heat shock protein Hsp15 [Gallibacterium genomosp. 2]KGQ30031.1 ribosome-associated heat shock protein Hsp15 [Gallibacterium genomosp. 2]